MCNVRELASKYILELSDKKSVLNYRINELNKKINSCLIFQSESAHTLKIMKMTSVVLQELIEVVLTRNLEKMEKLMDSALSSIFWDMNLFVKIEQKVKRNVNVYKIVIFKDGNRGTINSNGGGIWSIVAMIKKILCNVLLEKYPFIIFDESLSMVADRYIPTTVKFVQELANNLAFSVCNITHKTSFIELSPLVYKVDFVSREELSFVGNPKRLEDPYINVEKIERKVNKDEKISV